MYYNNITKTWELQLDAKFFQMTKGLWSKIMEDNNLFKNIVQRNYVHFSYFSVVYSHS